MYISLNNQEISARLASAISPAYKFLLIYFPFSQYFFFLRLDKYLLQILFLWKSCFGAHIFLAEIEP